MTVPDYKRLKKSAQSEQRDENWIVADKTKSCAKATALLKMVEKLSLTNFLDVTKAQSKFDYLIGEWLVIADQLIELQKDQSTDPEGGMKRIAGIVRLAPKAKALEKDILDKDARKLRDRYIADTKFAERMSGDIELIQKGLARI